MFKFAQIEGNMYKINVIDKTEKNSELEMKFLFNPGFRFVPPEAQEFLKIHLSKAYHIFDEFVLFVVSISVPVVLTSYQL
jgi:hypothetical protein